MYTMSIQIGQIIIQKSGFPDWPGFCIKVSVYRVGQKVFEELLNLLNE